MTTKAWACLDGISGLGKREMQKEKKEMQRSKRGDAKKAGSVGGEVADDEREMLSRAVTVVGGIGRRGW